MLDGDADFLSQRPGVLAEHPAGASVDVDEAVRWHRAVPPQERLPDALRAADEQGITLLQPRAGVPTPRAQRELLLHLRDTGHADLLTLTIDSYTRQHDFDKATEGLLLAERERTVDTLNGFPAISVGLHGTREVITGLACPVQTRHGHPDARLLAEVTLAAGCTGFEGGAITYCLPYSRSVPLADSLRHWAYVDRLCGRYAEQGVVIERESFGALTGILVPPSIAIACGAIEMLLAAEQGVASFSLGYAQCGEPVQDVAALRAMMEVAGLYAQGIAHPPALSSVFYQWMGPFPQEYDRAMAIIAVAATTAAVARPTRMIVKSPQEAHGVPDRNANAFGLQLSRAVMECLDQSCLGDPAAIAEEQEAIREEACCILDAVLDLAAGVGLAAAVVQAFQRGLVDVPFAPSQNALGLVSTGRDARRAVRFTDFGNLPFTDRMRERNHRHLGGEPAGSPLTGAVETATEVLLRLESAG